MATKGPPQARSKLREDLISNESACVNALNTIQATYLTALSEVRQKPAAFDATLSDITSLEINILTLSNLHSHQLKALQDSDSEKLPLAIAKHISGFVCYSDFLPRYEAALGILDRLKKKNSKFRKLMEGVDKKLDSGDKRLLDLLLVPLQKFFVYVSLLSDLVKSSSDAELKNGYEKLSDIVKQAEEGKQRMEATAKMTDIQASLKDLPKDFAWPPSRTLVREGVVKVTMETFSKKASSLKVAERLLYLFSDKLVVARTDNSYRYDASVGSLVVEAISETQTDFTVTNSTMSACFRCESANDRAQWIRDLESTKEAAKMQRQTLQTRNAKVAVTANIAEDLEKLRVAEANAQAETKRALEVKQATLVQRNSESKDLPEDPKEKAQVRREKLREELISTERTYARGLELLHLYYLTAIDVVRQNESSFSALPTDVAALEINLPMLWTLHSSLLRDMQESQPENLASVISKYAAVFHCYVDYLSRYEAALAVMERLKKKKKFKELIDAVDAKLSVEGGGKRLLDFLITPVQRLPRYVMLLAELLKNTEEDQPQYGELKAAHQKLQEIAMQVNEGKRKMETMAKLQEIQSLLKDLPADFTWPPHRTLVREGKLKVTMESFSDKAQSLKLTERLLYLFSDKLVLARTDYTYKFDVMISSVTVESIPESATDFTVTNSKMSVCFRCENSDERALWVKDLETTKEALKDQRGNKRLIRADLKKRGTLVKQEVSAELQEEFKKLAQKSALADSIAEDGSTEDKSEDKKIADPVAARRKLREDLIASEQSSLNVLNLLKSFYLAAVDQVRDNGSDYGSSASDAAALEINLPAMHSLHSQMLKDLQECDSDKFINVITYHAPSYGCYGNYLTKYETALAVMDRLKKKSKFKKLMESVDKKLLDAGSEKRLLDFLLAPVQKFFVFVNLLAELLKHSADHPKCSELKSSYALLYETALLAKEGKRQMEAATKMLEIQASLKDLPKDFTWPPSRNLVRESKLKVVMEAFSKKAMSLKVSERVLYLFSDKILVARVDRSFRYEAAVASILIEIITESPTDFTISNSTMSVCFRCENSEERAVWVKDLEATRDAAKAQRAELFQKRQAASPSRNSQAQPPPIELDN